MMMMMVNFNQDIRGKVFEVESVETIKAEFIRFFDEESDECVRVTISCMDIEVENDLEADTIGLIDRMVDDLEEKYQELAEADFIEKEWKAEQREMLSWWETVRA